MKFIVHWVRNPGVTLFESDQRRKEVAAQRPAGLKVLYAWYAVGEPEGVGIVEADDARDIAVQPLLHGWLQHIGLPGSVRLQVDVDPYSFL